MSLKSNKNKQFSPQPSRSILPTLMIEGLVILLVLGLAILTVVAVNNQVYQSVIPTTAAAAINLLSGQSPTPGKANLTHSNAPTTTPQVFSLAPTGDISNLLTPGTPASPEGIFNFPQDVDPLTGLKVDDPSRLDRRPIMVKVSNFPRTGRPHAGLSYADIVFEYYIGFGLNRFAAIYLGQDSPQVGPIRSGRLVDAQLGEMYQSILVYGDADPTIDDVIVGELGKRALAEKYLPSPPKTRLGGGISETNLFVNTAQTTDYVNENHLVSDARRDLHGMVFGDQLNLNSQIATEVGIQYGKITRGEWQYDVDKGKYLAWTEEPKGDNDLNMIPLIDRLNKEQLSFSNIIILFATYKEYAPTKHDVMLYNNPDGKRAIFFRDGLMTEGIWRTPSNGMPIQFFNSWNTYYQLKPGNTWIVLAGNSSIFGQPQKGDWELRFDLP